MGTAAGKNSTSALWERFFRAPTVEQFVTQNENEIGLSTFCDYIAFLCKQRNEVPERVIKRADLESSFGHSVFRGDRKPSRDTVLQLAFGFEADVELAQSLLRHAGHSLLYPRVQRDLVIAYGLHHKNSIVETQQMLADAGLPLIGARKNG